MLEREIQVVWKPVEHNLQGYLEVAVPDLEVASALEDRQKLSRGLGFGPSGLEKILDCGKCDRFGQHTYGEEGRGKPILGPIIEETDGGGRTYEVQCEGTDRRLPRGTPRCIGSFAERQIIKLETLN